jgi:adenylate cyclase
MESRLAAILVVEVAKHPDDGMDAAAARAVAARVIAYELVDPTIARFRGRILSVAMDRTLAEFGEAGDALACALEIQRGMAEPSRTAPGAPSVELRLGLDLAEILLDHGQVQDQALAVVCRLAALAPPGGIAASGAIGQRIKRRSFHAEFTLQGVDTTTGRPVQVVHIHPLVAEGAQSPWILRRHWTVTAAIAAIVVLSIATAVLWRPVLEPLLGPGPGSDPGMGQTQGDDTGARD